MPIKISHSNSLSTKFIMRTICLYSITLSHTCVCIYKNAQKSKRKRENFHEKKIKRNKKAIFSKKKKKSLLSSHTTARVFVCNNSKIVKVLTRERDDDDAAWHSPQGLNRKIFLVCTVYTGRKKKKTLVCTEMPEKLDNRKKRRWVSTTKYISHNRSKSRWWHLYTYTLELFPRIIFSIL